MLPAAQRLAAADGSDSSYSDYRIHSPARGGGVRGMGAALPLPEGEVEGVGAALPLPEGEVEGVGVWRKFQNPTPPPLGKGRILTPAF